MFCCFGITTILSIIIALLVIFIDLSPSTPVLILYKLETNKPALISASGLYKQISFDKGENTEVYQSCGLTWKNQFYIFGGYWHKKTQISTITNCELRNIGRLPFDFAYGACTNVADKKFYLCFHDDRNTAQQCHEATSPLGKFEAISKSRRDHRKTRIASSQGMLN